jgi:hypothetical protein
VTALTDLKMSFALRPLGAAVRRSLGRQVAREQPHQAQQTRGMAGGDDGVVRYDWWAYPTQPDLWKKHQVRGRPIGTSC